MGNPLARVDKQVYQLYKRWKKQGRVKSFPEFTRVLVREKTTRIDEIKVWGFFK